MSQKAFNRILFELGHSPHKAKKLIADQRLSQIEKRILECHLLVRNNKNESALEILTRISPSNLEFVESQRLLLIGVALNNLSRFSEANQKLKQASHILNQLNSYSYLFTAYFNLFLVHYNLSNTDLMLEYIKLMKTIKPLNKIQTVRLYRCQFLYFTEIEEFIKAEEYLHLIKISKNEMLESDQISHLIGEFNFHLKRKKFTECYQTLAEMKKHRKFQLSENFNFIKLLLDHLQHDKPIYAYDQDFKKIPLLFHQLKVIQSLESSDLPAAHKHWNELNQMQPEIYLKNFKYQSSICLFSLCLNKYENTFDHADPEIKKKKTKIATLIELLTSSKTILTKERIYRYLWGESPKDKSDLNKLTRMVSKIRDVHHLNIKTRKGCYYIDSKKSKLKAG
jgi:hypothetical protein